MGATRLSALDSAWFLMESRDTPMHVGSLFEFEAPADAEPDFLRSWHEAIRKEKVFAPPFNQVPVRGPFGGAKLPWLRDTQDVDLSHHVRLWGLPRPGSQRELGVLVSELHSHQLDFKRPLWEVHVIDRLEGNRFAIYLKLHHSLIDGVSGLRHVLRSLSTDPNDRGGRPLWAIPRPPSTHVDQTGTKQGALRSAGRGIAGLIAAAKELRTGEIDGQPLRAPYDVPDSPLGVQFNGRRRLATQQYELGQLKALARAAECSLNDLVLYLCGTALRSYLSGLGELPDKALTAGIPVNLREPGDERPGTAIGFMVAELGTHIADPQERLAAVSASSAAAKKHLRKLPQESLPFQTVLVNAPYIAGLIAGMGHRSPIAFSIGISNVAGPKEQLYFNGARLAAMYPVSLLTQGNALNITCVSHDDKIDFGIVGARDALPHLQRLATQMRAAVEELAQLLLKRKESEDG